MHKILWDYEIYMDNKIPARKLYLLLINEKKKQTGHSMDFAISADHREENKRKQKERQILYKRTLKNSTTWMLRWYQLYALNGSKGLEVRQEELDIRGRIDNIQTIALLRSA